MDLSLASVVARVASCGGSPTLHCLEGLEAAQVVEAVVAGYAQGVQQSTAAPIGTTIIGKLCAGSTKPVHCWRTSLVRN